MAGAEVKSARPLRADTHTTAPSALRASRPTCGRFEAVVAIAARLARFAEIREQAHAAARRRFAQPEQRIELAALDALVRVVGVGFVDHLALLHDVAETVAIHAFAGMPSRPARPVSW